MYYTPIVTAHFLMLNALRHCILLQLLTSRNCCTWKQTFINLVNEPKALGDNADVSYRGICLLKTVELSLGQICGQIPMNIGYTVSNIGYQILHNLEHILKDKKTSLKSQTTAAMWRI